MQYDAVNERHVLIAENDMVLSDLLSSVLEKKGYAVTSTGVGANVIQTLLRQAPDVILLDTDLPDMSGFKLCKRIKNNNRYKDIPVILVSERKDLENRLRGFLAGANRYVCKPYGVYDMVRCVGFFCEKRDAMPPPESLMEEVYAFV